MRQYLSTLVVGCCSHFFADLERLALVFVLHDVE
jgi:hypothetical protein